MAGFHAAHRGAGNLALEALLLRQRYGTVEAAFDIGARHAAEVFLRNLVSQSIGGSGLTRLTFAVVIPMSCSLQSA